jgi:phage antirepressor YoqD-like protein
MKKVNNTFSISQTAKLCGFPGGEKKFFEWLRTNKILMQDNFAYQQYIDQGWFETVLKTLYKTNPKMEISVTRTTIKGVYCLSKLVKKDFPPCKPCN